MTALPNIIYKWPFILQFSANVILRRHYRGIYLFKNPCFMLCRWLRQLKVKKTTEVALDELCLSPKSVFTPAFRCITDEPLSCGCFPHNESVVYKWLDYPFSRETRNQIKAINAVKRAGTPWIDNNLLNAVKLNELKLGNDDKFEFFLPWNRSEIRYKHHRRNRLGPRRSRKRI